MNPIHFVIAFLATFVSLFIIMPIALGIIRLLGLYATVQERTCRVYTLFGKVIAVLDEPGLHILPFKLGGKAFLVHFFGKCHIVDLSLDQEYLRSQPVNSEEGAPMGIGIWYEMSISDPIAYLFKNSDPQGSLSANVTNATVRCLSNMPLGSMLEDRHRMSQTVRHEVSEKSTTWGYSVGSVYIRKVHFRDVEMIRQIEAKVINRLRQVTAAIKQSGANEVSIIASTAERQAAIEFARASAIRPAVVGATLQKISQDPKVEQSLFELLEIQRIHEAGMPITMVPANSNPMLTSFMAAFPPRQPQQQSQ
ncbi:SPFH/Band 7/PHB domain protein [Candidatus Sumerlaeota bacterium]|nr:SPFH/Band 7/PHB domain protein [Candidatus Sumerlaeota bacterium]